MVQRPDRGKRQLDPGRGALAKCDAVEQHTGDVSPAVILDLKDLFTTATNSADQRALQVDQLVNAFWPNSGRCLLYTSDAADE